MRRFIFTLTCLALAVSLHAADSDQQVTYWIAETDSTGFTIQNVHTDLPVYVNGQQEQKPGIGNIALNAVILRNGVLVRPERGTHTISVTYDDSTASVWMRGALPPLGSLQRSESYLVTDYVFNRRTQYGLNSPLRLMRTVNDSAGVDTTTAEATWTE